MASKFKQDEFGLFHAAVLHPHDPRAIQIMVFKSDGGWWAYVDGKRLDGTFRSRFRAGRAAKLAAKQLPTSTRPTTRRRAGSFVRGIRSGRMAGVAAYALTLMVACSAVLFVFGAIDSASNLSASATTYEVEEFVPEMPFASAGPPLPEMKKRTAKPAFTRVRAVSRGIERRRTARIAKRRAKRRPIRTAKRWAKRKHKNIAVWAKDIPMPSQD